MTFFTGRPSRARWTASSARTAAMIVASSACRSTTSSARFFPLTCTGSLSVSAMASDLSTTARSFPPPVSRAERRPAFFGEMRHHRRKQLHEDVRGLAEGESANRSEMSSTASPSTASDRAFDNLRISRDRRVEAQARDEFLGLQQMPLDQLADGGRPSAEIRRRIGARRCGDALQLADEPPQIAGRIAPRPARRPRSR